MTQATPPVLRPSAELPAEDDLPRIPHAVPLSAVVALLGLSFERVIRGRRLLILALLFCLPAGIALLARYYNPDYTPREAEEVLVFYLITNALVPFSALVLASGIIQDEVEEQTLTYLLIRPLPKWLIYSAKLAAVAFLAALMTTLFTVLTLVAISYGTGEHWQTTFPGTSLRMAGLLALASATYCSLFGALSLFLRRSLVVGVAYIILFEGVFANIDFVVRRFTVMYYTRVLSDRWLGLHVESWAINLDDAPSGRTCLLILIGAMVAATVAASLLFTFREFRVKTPEGS